MNITHSLNGDTRTLDYGGYDAVGNRKWTQRDGGNGDVFGYDLNDQVTAVQFNIANPTTTAPGNQTIIYDANGNRIWFSPPGWNQQYTNTDHLNQYINRTTGNGMTTAAYNPNGDMTTGLDGSVYAFDAQNRLLIAISNGTTETFAYDGLNRQVSRTINHVITYNVYDGWDLIGEYASGANTPTAAYVGGAGGFVKNLVTNRYYYQDASGSTSHLADSNGNLLEWYRYDLQGTPIFYNPGNTQILSSNYGVRHLFTGQQWYSELGLYDLRNRYYSPDIGRFLQVDPSGFAGDATNLYRYCGNNPLKRSDRFGLGVNDTPGTHLQTENIETVDYPENIVVTGDQIIPNYEPPANPFNSQGVPFGLMPDSINDLSALSRLTGPSDGGVFGLTPQHISIGNPLRISPPPAQNPFTPTPTSSLVLPSLTNTTYFVGFSLTGIVGWGGTAQVGIYGGPNGIGLYYNGGQGYGIDVAPPPPNVVAGYVNGPFDGPFVNSNFAALTNGASSFHNSFGQTVGYGISLGPQLTPVSMSTTYTNTWITPPVQLIFLDPVVLPRHY